MILDVRRLGDAISPILGYDLLENAHLYSEMGIQGYGRSAKYQDQKFDYNHQDLELEITGAIPPNFETGLTWGQLDDIIEGLYRWFENEARGKYYLMQFKVSTSGSAYHVPQLLARGGIYAVDAASSREFNATAIS